MVGVHSKKEQRYRCHCCKRTFSATYGTPLYGLKTEVNIVVLVMTLLMFGCPVPAIVAAFKLDERTLADWIDKAGEHAQRVQEQLVCRGQLNLGQVQADELWLRSQRGVLWLATALSVQSRLLIWGKLASDRSESLITEVVRRVHRAARLQSPILWATDGYRAWKSQILQVFRAALLSGRPGGLASSWALFRPRRRPRLVAWAERHIVQVVKRTFGERIEKRVAFGDLFESLYLIERSQGKPGTINTAFVERLNATLRTWLPALRPSVLMGAALAKKRPSVLMGAALAKKRPSVLMGAALAKKTRRTRHAGCDQQRLERHFFLVVAGYNFIRPHRSLRVRLDGHWVEQTRGMVAGLTDHPWSVEELLTYRVPPSANAAY